MNQKKLYLGIDIGGTNTKIGLVDREQGAIKHLSFPTEGQRDFSHFLHTLKSQISLLLKETGTTSLVAAGVGAPDVNFSTGRMEGPPNLSWGSFPIQEQLEKAIGIPVVLDNDASLFALAEMRYGAGQNLSHFILVTLGTGVGTGLILNGQLIRGHNFLAGEGGHFEVQPGGRLCPCGKRGHLEAYLGAKGLSESAWELTGFKTTPPEISSAYNRGDKWAIKVVEYSALQLARACANWIALVGPEKIIITGGVSHLGPPFCQLVQNFINDLAFHNVLNSTSVVQGKLNPDYGAFLGGAALAMDLFQE